MTHSFPREVLVGDLTISLSIELGILNVLKVSEINTPKFTQRMPKPQVFYF